MNAIRKPRNESGHLISFLDLVKSQSCTACSVISRNTLCFVCVSSHLWHKGKCDTSYTLWPEVHIPRFTLKIEALWFLCLVENKYLVYAFLFFLNSLEGKNTLNLAMIEIYLNFWYTIYSISIERVSQHNGRMYETWVLLLCLQCSQERNCTQKIKVKNLKN